MRIRVKNKRKITKSKGAKRIVTRIMRDNGISCRQWRVFNNRNSRSRSTEQAWQLADNWKRGMKKLTRSRRQYWKREIEQA